MANDYGIQISAPGVSVSGAKTSQLLLNTEYAFLKIDTQNDAGFRTITLLITNEPPYNPPSGYYNTWTVLYKFKHGYTYIPCLESLFYINSAPAGNNPQQYFMDYGIICQQTPADSVYLYAVADTSYVYIICDKYGANDLISGTTVQITTHVFVQDIGV